MKLYIQIPYNLDNLVYDAGQLPEVVISTPNKFGITPTNNPDIYRTTNGDFVKVDRGTYSKNALSFINPYDNKRVYTDDMLAENQRANTRYENFLLDRAIALSMGLDPILPFLNLANGQYSQAFNNAINSLAWLAGPVGVAARTYVGARNLTSDDGLRKTYKLFDSGLYDKAALSAIGDIFNAAAVKYGVNAGMQKAYPFLLKFGSNLSNFGKQFNENYLLGALRRTKDIQQGYDPYTIYYGDNPGTLIYNTPLINPYINQKQINRLLEYTKTFEFKNKLNLLPLPELKKLLEYINSWKNAVSEDGTINSHEVVSKLRLLEEKYPHIFDNPVTHPRDTNPVERYQSTLRHMYNAAKSAQTMPVAKGSTRQELVFAALTHDIGEFVNRDNHPKESVKLLKELYPDVPKKVLHSISMHMDKDVLAQTALTRALHFADVASGEPYERKITMLPTLQYPQLDMATNIGKIGDDKWEYVVDKYINPILEKRDYPLIDTSKGYDAARKQLIDVITQDRTFTRGVRLESRDINIDKSINKLKDRLTKQLGREPTYEEIRRLMVSEIPPYTGSGRRGLPEMKDSMDKDHSYNGLYYSNSDETGGGYGANYQGGALYKSTLPIVDKPEYSLMDLWLANNYPLYDVFKYKHSYNKVGLDDEYINGDLHTKTQTIKDDDELLNFKKFIESGGNPRDYKILNDANLRRQYVLNIIYQNGIIQADPSYFDQYMQSPLFLRLLPKIRNRMKYNPFLTDGALQQVSIKNYRYFTYDHNTNSTVFNKDRIINSMFPFINVDSKYEKPDGFFADIYKNVPELKLMNSLTSYIKRSRKKLLKELSTIGSMGTDYNDPLDDYVDSFFSDNSEFSHQSDPIVNIGEYLTNKRVSEQNKKILLELLGIDLNKEKNVKNIKLSVKKLNDGLRYKINNKISDYLDTELFKEAFFKYVSNLFYEAYKHQQRAFYMKNRMDFIKKLLEKLSNDASKFVSTEPNEDGLVSPILTKEFLRQPKIFTTEGTTINYKDRKAAQHYIFFDKTGRLIFKPEDVKKVGSGSERKSKDRGAMNPDLSHKTYYKGKDI